MITIRNKGIAESRDTIAEREETIGEIREARYEREERIGERGKGAERVDDPLENYPVYVKSLELFDLVVDDTDILIKDIRGREIARQLIRSAGSISANFEEGFGRGSQKEFSHYLRISRGSARETKGWYRRSKKFLPEGLIASRIDLINEIIAISTSMVRKLGD